MSALNTPFQLVPAAEPSPYDICVCGAMRMHHRNEYSGFPGVPRCPSYAGSSMAMPFRFWRAAFESEIAQAEGRQP